MKKNNILICILFYFIVSETYSQINWQQLNGPYSGSIWQLCVHPNGNIFARGGGSLIYKSEDQGANWKTIHISHTHHRSINMLTDKSGYIYITTGDSGLFRSEDEAESWISILPIDSYPCALGMDNNGDLYVGTYNHGMFYSTDHGNHWVQMGTTIRDFEVDEILVNKKLDIFAGTEYGILRSTNRGQNWEWVNDGLTVGEILAMLESENGDLFVGTWGGGIYRSTNNGSTWFTANNGVDPYYPIENLNINPSGHLFAASYGDRVYRSTDNGNSWTKLIQGLTDINMFSVVSLPSGLLLAGGHYGGVFLSTDNGDHWINQSNGILNAIISQLEYSNGSILAFVSGIGIEKSNNGGNTWITLNEGLTNATFGRFAIAPNGFWFINSWGDGVFRSTDNGQSWHSINNGIICGEYSYSLTVNPNGHLFLGMDWCKNSIYRSTNNGDSWEALNTDSFKYKGVGYFAHAGPGDILASVVVGLYRSTDDGNNWFKTSYPGSGPIAIDENGIIYVGTGRRFIKSTDNGNTWLSYNITNSDFSVNDICIASNDVIYVCGFNGEYPVYQSTDQGVTWFSVSNGIYGGGESLVIDADGYLFAGTSGNSLFKSADRVININTDNEIIPKQMLNQNYPNPFNATTMIEFTIPHSCFVDLSLYNVLGQEITKLIHKQMPSGKHAIQWNAGSYSSGIYFCRLKTESGIRTKKLLLIK